VLSKKLLNFVEGEEEISVSGRKDFGIGGGFYADGGST